MHSILLTNSPILVTYASYATIRMNYKGLRSAPDVLPTAYVELLLFYCPQATRVCAAMCLSCMSQKEYLFNPPIARIVHLSSFARTPVLYPTEVNVLLNALVDSLSRVGRDFRQGCPALSASDIMSRFQHHRGCLPVS